MRWRASNLNGVSEQVSSCISHIQSALETNAANELPLSFLIVFRCKVCVWSNWCERPNLNRPFRVCASSGAGVVN